MSKKLQIFISSTFNDLIEERQAAVEAVLEAGHIPAGMELFAADNKSQLQVIKRWIDDSDIYLLILGGRYGSIELETQMSYTQLEYEYALQKGMPLFAVFLSDTALAGKTFTEENQVKYIRFKELVLSKMCKKVDDLKEIKLAIFQTIYKFDKEYEFDGWISGREIKNSSVIRKRTQKEIIEKLPHNLLIKHYHSQEALNPTIELTNKTMETKELFLNLGSHQGSFRMRAHPHGSYQFIVLVKQFGKNLKFTISKDYLEENGLLKEGVIIQATTYDFKGNGVDDIIIAVNSGVTSGEFWIFSYTDLEDLVNYDPYLVKLSRFFQSKLWIDENKIIIPYGGQGLFHSYSYFENNFYEECSRDDRS